MITEARDLRELEEIMRKHMDYYNNKRRHSSIDNQAPAQYLKEYLHREDVAAN